MVLCKFIPSSRNRLRVNPTDDVADHLTLRREHIIV